MTLYLMIVRNAVPISMPAYLRLAIEIATGAGIYYITLATLHRDRLRRVYSLLRPATAL